MKGKYTMKAKTVLNAALIAALASFLGAADAEAVRSGLGCRTAIERLAADFDFQGETSTRDQPTTQDPTVWVTGRASTFYPPDAAEAAIDLDALIVVRVPDNRRSARAADTLLRSGGFGLIVLDLGADMRGFSPPMQSRLVGLAKKHQAALICLTQKESRHPSIGALVSIREIGRASCRERV